MELIMRYFSVYERHETKTDMSLNLAFKLTVVKFLNTSVIYIIVHNDAQTWFENGDLATDVFTVLIFLMITPFLALLIVMLVKLVQKSLICY